MTDQETLREWAEDEAYDYTLSDEQRALLHRAADALDQSTQLRAQVDQHEPVWRELLAVRNILDGDDGRGVPTVSMLAAKRMRDLAAVQKDKQALGSGYDEAIERAGWAEIQNTELREQITALINERDAANQQASDMAKFGERHANMYKAQLDEALQELARANARRDEALAEVGELSDQLDAALNESAADRHALDNLVDQAGKISAVKDIADDMEESGFSRLIQFAAKLRAAVAS